MVYYKLKINSDEERVYPNSVINTWLNLYVQSGIINEWSKAMDELVDWG